jgi:hypothetical protein
VLADTFILSFDPGRGHPFRVAGTRVCALFGRELKGHGFLDLWARANRKDLRTLIAIVADESVGLVAAAGAGDALLGLELLLLPLSHHGQGDARLLGALAPSEPPPWLGTHALRDLTLGTHRYVGPPWRAMFAPSPRSCRAGACGMALWSMTAAWVIPSRHSGNEWRRACTGTTRLV